MATIAIVNLAMCFAILAMLLTTCVLLLLLQQPHRLHRLRLLQLQHRHQHRQHRRQRPHLHPPQLPLLLYRATLRRATCVMQLKVTAARISFTTKVNPIVPHVRWASGVALLVYLRLPLHRQPRRQPHRPHPHRLHRLLQLPLHRPPKLRAHSRVLLLPVRCVLQLKVHAALIS